MDRRSFLAGTGALAAGLALGEAPSLAKEPEMPSVNGTLEAIAALLKEKKLVESAEFLPAEDAAKGIVQWRWAHFRPEIRSEYVPHMQRVNRELFHAMSAVRALPGAGLEELMHEGIIEGRTDDVVRRYRETHREIIRYQLATRAQLRIPYKDPTEEDVDREANVFANIDRPVIHTLQDARGTVVQELSVLTRLGAGYALVPMHGVALRASEDPAIDAKAAEHEFEGDTPEFRRWVHVERDKHFVKLAAASPRPIEHLLVGYSHVLTDDVAAHNASSKNAFSHLVVTVPGIPAVEALDKELFPKTAK